MSTRWKHHHPLLLLGWSVGNLRKANPLVCISQYTGIDMKHWCAYCYIFCLFFDQYTQLYKAATGGGGGSLLIHPSCPLNDRMDWGTDPTWAEWKQQNRPYPSEWNKNYAHSSSSVDLLNLCPEEVKRRPWVLPFCVQLHVFFDDKSVYYFMIQLFLLLCFSLVKSKPTWQHPKELKLKGKKYFCCKKLIEIW